MLTILLTGVLETQTVSSDFGCPVSFNTRPEDAELSFEFSDGILFEMENTDRDHQVKINALTFQTQTTGLTTVHVYAIEDDWFGHTSESKEGDWTVLLSTVINSVVGEDYLLEFVKPGPFTSFSLYVTFAGTNKIRHLEYNQDRQKANDVLAIDLGASFEHELDGNDFGGSRTSGKAFDGVVHYCTVKIE
jgi:hypothetical protein